MSDKQAAAAEGETVSKAEYEKAITRAQNMEARLVDMEKRFNGIDPEAAKAWREENEILRREQVKVDPKKLEEFETRLKGDLEKRYSSKLTEYEQKASKLETELKELKVYDRALAAASARFKPEAMKMIRLLAQQDLDWSDGKIVVKGEDGKPKPSKANPRNDMDLNEWIEELVQDHAYAALPTAKGGGREAGERSQGNVSGEPSVDQYLKMDPKDRQKLPPALRVKLFQQVAQSQR